MASLLFNPDVDGFGSNGGDSDAVEAEQGGIEDKVDSCDNPVKF